VHVRKQADSKDVAFEHSAGSGLVGWRSRWNREFAVRELNAAQVFWHDLARVAQSHGNAALLRLARGDEMEL
jgi:hypothetical protein